MEKRSVFFLILIILIAAFFRLWQLDKIPPGLYPDVALNGNEAIEGLKTRKFKVFYPENNGREGLWMWLIALSFSIFGVSIWSIKIVAAIFGILTVLGLYLLTKELFNNESIALLSSFFLAISFWHTLFSRIGFRAILLPFILVFSFYFLLKGFRTKKISKFIFAGIFFGLGFYTYSSFRMAVLFLPFVLIPYWLIYKKEGSQKKFISYTLYFLLTTFIVALPIGIYFLKNPQDFVGRMTPISIFAADNPIKEFFKSLILHFGMFNFYGDNNWRHNFAGSPMLPWSLGILFLIGILFSIKELISSFKRKDSSFIIHSLLLSWFLIMLLPGILTYEGIPHALRVIGVIPAVYILAGLGGWKVYKFFEKNTKRKKLFLTATILFLIAISLSEFDKYFLRWGKNKEVQGAFTTRFAEEGYFLNSLPEGYRKYVIVNESGVPVPWPNGIPMPAQTIIFIESTKYGSPKSIYLLPEDLNQLRISIKTVILSMAYDQNFFDKISQRFPQVQFKEINGIWVYKSE